MRFHATLLAAVTTVAWASAPASAARITYPITATGPEEVAPNVGDPDGRATGFLILDNGTGVGTTGTAEFNLTLTNIDLTDLRGHHVHEGTSIMNGMIRLDFGDPDLLRTGNTLLGTVTGLSAPQVTAVFANPTGFYYNLHNAAFTAGAVRDQLPEPGCLAIVGLGAMGLLARRRRPA